MPSDSHRGPGKRQVPGPKCSQCNVEKRDPARTDGLGRSCGAHKDKSQRVAREYAERAGK